MMREKKTGGLSAQDNNGQREALDRLEREAAKRFADWNQRGVDDPVRALMESFAVVLGELRGELEQSTARLLPRLLAELGHEPSWPRAASSAIRLHAEAGLDAAKKVPAGTAVTASRAGAREGRVFFETAADAWVSPASLDYAVVLEGEETRHLPLAGEDHGPVRLFGSDRLNHHLYIGDAEWDEVRRYSAELVIEWPGVAAALLDGEWEYSSGTGWRLLPVDFSQSVSTAGDPLVRMRIHGPLPDMTSRELEGFEAPWIRLRLPPGSPVSMKSPTMVWSLRRDKRSKQKKPLGRSPERIFLHSGDTWQDHSFVTDGGLELAGMHPRARPAVYLGWDQPGAACLYWQNASMDSGLGSESPRLDWEYSIGDSFRALTAMDATGAFTHSGTISWDAPAGWERRRLFGRELYWVRASWSAGLYLNPVFVGSVLPGGVEVVEGRTVERQPATLRFRDSVAVLPPHPDGDFEPFENLSLVIPAGGEQEEWKTLRLQREKGTPEPGRFRLRRRSDGGVEVLAGAGLAGPVKARIEAMRTGIGRAGPEFNGRLDVLEYEAAGIASVSHPIDVLDGCGRESAGSFQRRLAVESSMGSAVVSVADYRRLLRAIDPGLSRIEVVTHPHRPAEIWVVAWGAPVTGEDGFSICEPLGARRLSALENYLQRRVPLGTVVHLVEALAIPFKLVLSWPGEALSTRRQKDLLSRLEVALREDLDPLTGGEGGGGCPLVSDLAAGDFQERVSEVCSAAGLTERPVARMESALAPGAALEIPIAVALLETIEFEWSREQLPLAREEEIVK